MYLEDFKESSDEYIQNLLKQKDNGREKKIIYLNTMEIFSSINEASAKVQCNANSISQCCLHNRANAGKTPDGEPRIFMYYSEYLNN